MNLLKIMEVFPDQEACITYLERLRWHGSPECPIVVAHTSDGVKNTTQGV